MRLRHLLSALAVPAMLWLSACQKERLVTGDQVATSTHDPLAGPKKAYQEHGKVAQAALAAGLNDPEIRALLREQALVMEDGDTEVLLKDFLDFGMKSGGKVKNTLLARYNERFPDQRIDLDALTAFSREFPSIIVGVRGPVLDWETSEHVPSILFLPLDFKESTPSMPGMRPNGEMVEVDISDQFSEVVLTLAPSERHTAYGELKVNASLARHGNGTAVNINEVAKDKGEGGGTIGSNNNGCDGVAEPVNCAVPSGGLSTPVTMTANSTANGIVLTWDPGNYAQYAGLGTWARWVIRRNNVVIGVRYACEAPTFTDVNLAPFATYTYTVRFSFVAQNETCSSGFAVATATASGLPEPPQNFSEDIQTAGSVNFFWLNPPQYASAIQIDKYDYTQEQWDFVATLPPTATSFNHTNTLYRVRNLYRIRIHGLTGWSNPTYAVFMNPSRNSGEKSLIYGFKIPSVSLIENAALGSPELHISATNGTLSATTGLPTGNLLHNKTFMPLTSCGAPKADQYRPTTGVAVTLFNQWLYSLYGAVCRVALVETDETDPYKDNLQVSTGSVSNFSLGTTVPINPSGQINTGSIAGSSSIQMSNSTQYSINTVDGDLNLGNFDILYWDQQRKTYFGTTIQMRVSADPNDAVAICD